MLVVWGRLNAVNVQKVLWCCEELGLPYERRDAGRGFGHVDTPEYRRMNPNGRVPTIEDDGFVLWESNTIVRYLSRKHSAAGLLPSALHESARAEQWMDWQISVVWPPMRDLVLTHVLAEPATKGRAEDDKALEGARRAWTILDVHLEHNAYVAGDRFSVADIPLGAWVWRRMALPIERPALHHLSRWFEALSQRPAYARLVMQPLS